MTPGDEVVCVRIDETCPTCRWELAPEYVRPVVGQHYIVILAVRGRCGNCEHEIPVVRTVGCPLPRRNAWPMDWFRPLEYDEDGALVPERVGETA